MLRTSWTSFNTVGKSFQVTLIERMPLTKQSEMCKAVFKAQDDDYGFSYISATQPYWMLKEDLRGKKISVIMM